MKRVTLLAAIAVLTTFASAGFVSTNGSHYIDPDSKEAVRKFGCGAKIKGASNDFLKTIKNQHKGHQKGAHGSRAARPLTKKQVTTPITIPTYFHVLTTTANAGAFTQQMADAQAAALNTAYNPYGISFTLQNTSFTANDVWAIAETDVAMDEAKAALRAGTYGSLNIYFHSDFAGGNLGTCTLPSTVPAAAAPAMFVSDGCNVNANTMPGGTMVGYNQGGTAVHETGHWLGLLHTFEGYSCEGDGDFIDDTPMQSQSTDGCPEKPAKDSCPSKTGVDPIHNYMDYSTDACYEAFTPGQIARIETMWNQFRLGM